MRLTRSAFTFVELIVVLVIIAILSTIGFTVYESYLWTGRDTKRIVQMKELQTAFQEYSFREKLPLPDDSIQLRASWSLYAYQGYISEDILKQLSFKANVYDDTVESFPVYLLWVNQKDFQFLTYLEDPASTAFLKSQVFAKADYKTLFPKTFGKPLWVLLEQDTNTPLQDIGAIKTLWYYDVVTGTGMISAYLSEQKILESDQDDLRQLLPQNSCKRIMELGYSKWSGEYTISPDGNTKIQAYCDMDTDGWGWTLVLNYLHKWWTNPVTIVLSNKLPLLWSLVLGKDESNTIYWGHASNNLMQKIYFENVRFYWKTNQHSRILHFISDACNQYFKTWIWYCWNQIKNSYSRLYDDTSVLFTNLNQGWNNNMWENAMTEYVVWVTWLSRWNIRWSDTWELDNDITGYSYHTHHQIFIR